MTSWERKTLTFISQTSDWNSNVISFLSFSIALLRELTGAYMSLRLDFEDDLTIKVKEATPDYLNELVYNPAPVRELLESNGNKIIYWQEIPERNVFDNLLQALSSAVILPVNSGRINAVILLGWSEPQQFDVTARECLEIIRSRLKEIMSYVHIQHIADNNAGRFPAILHTIPYALVFIANSGEPGWVNKKAAALLQLAEAGEQHPNVLSGAMAQLIHRTVNKDVISKEAVQLFTSWDSGLKDMLWELAPPDGQLKVSCLPVIVQTLRGKLWIFTPVD